MKPTRIVLALFIFFSHWMEGQNLVPNPSFENMQQDCEMFNPELICSEFWSDYLNLDPVNTPDLGYEGAVFFPPSTIDAHDGNQYLNIECSTGNPEYIQVDLLEPMVGGTSYCVSFYASVTQESPEVAPSLGALFTDTPLTDSPFELGLTADVQGPVDFDPSSWTLITGTYTAAGGESILVLAGFENTGTMPFPYMYIDMVSVVPMPPIVMEDIELCDESASFDVAAAGATYVWNTGANTASIVVSTPGVYSVIRTIGTCTQEASAEVLTCTDDPDITDPTDTVPTDSTDNPTDIPIDVPTDSTTEVVMKFEDYLFYIPNAFTPDGDGINDVFGVVGPETDSFKLQIYNRWGELVYDSSDIRERWTGNHVGGEYFVPDGVYTYRMKAMDGIYVFEERGHVVVMR